MAKKQIEILRTMRDKKLKITIEPKSVSGAFSRKRIIAYFLEGKEISAYLFNKLKKSGMIVSTPIWNGYRSYAITDKGLSEIK